MRILIAGATGVLGLPLARSLRDLGHEVVGTSRSPARATSLEAAGVSVALVDAYDRDRLRSVLLEVAPDVVVHQLTDLAQADTAANARLRTVGTRNLADAARAAGVRTMLAQSIAWAYESGVMPADEATPLDTDAAEPRATTVAGVAALEGCVSKMQSSVILRYGTLYGPGTWYERGSLMAERALAGSLTPTGAITCFVHVDDAVRATVQALDWPAGPVNIVDDHPAPDTEWMPLFCRRVGGEAPRTDLTAVSPSLRPVDNAYAHRLGWTPAYPDWTVALGRDM